MRLPSSMIWDLLELFNQHFTPLSFGEGYGGEARPFTLPPASASYGGIPTVSFPWPYGSISRNT